MTDYGVTPQGVVIMRLDEILEELHTDISVGWGVNTRMNPQSFLTVLLTSVSDKFGKLWEFGEQVYHSLYPFSSENASLDNAVQFGGTSRGDARPTYYPIHCECIDGTTVKAGAVIKTDTNPAVQFVSRADSVVSRSACNRAKVRVAVVQPSTAYTVALDGGLYSYASSPGDTEAGIISGLALSINAPGFTVSANGNQLGIASDDVRAPHELILSGNLTTQSVTGVVNFASEQMGEVSVPDGTITQIVTAPPGLLGVVNQLPYIAGRLAQDDVGTRQSYADKIFLRSNRMLESIKSALLNNVQGVKAAAGYQNESNIEDAYGRWPHCIELVVDGGDDYAVAMEIWDKKTDGIHTFGGTEVIVPGDEGEPVTIRFNRPEYVYVWWRVAITLSHTEPLPPNYSEAIQNIVMDEMSKAAPGKPIIPQRLIEHRIYSAVPGIAFIETSTFYTADQNEAPDVYATGIIPVTPRQRAVTNDTRIGVVLSG